MGKLNPGTKVVILVVTALLIGLIWLISAGIQADNKERADREQWAHECHSIGYVIVTIGDYNHCMSWEDAKEKGIELEAR